jgi:hypothetical protein
VEDAARPTATREHLDLVGDACAGRVDEVDERHTAALGALLNAQNLLDGALPPGTGLDRRIVRHHTDRATVDPARARHDTIGREVARETVRERGVLDERALVQQQGEPLAAEELPVIARLLVILRGATPPDLLETLDRLLFEFHR